MKGTILKQKGGEELCFSGHMKRKFHSLSRFKKWFNQKAIQQQINDIAHGIEKKHVLRMEEIGKS